MGARNWVGIGLSYRPARLYSLEELVSGNRFLGSLKVKKFGLCTTTYSYSVPSLHRLFKNSKHWFSPRRYKWTSTVHRKRGRKLNVPVRIFNWENFWAGTETLGCSAKNNISREVAQVYLFRKIFVRWNAFGCMFSDPLVRDTDPAPNPSLFT